MAVCYRHPDRETGVSCSSCGQSICTDCMTATPVGMRCPECASQKTQVRTMQSVRGGDPIATYVIMAICALVYLSGGVSFENSRGAAFEDGALYGPLVADGEWWRLASYGFLHANLIHIGFNLYSLYWLGTMLEPGIGRGRFLGIYFASLVGGALGALLLSPADAVTVGASGAVFGLMGAALVLQRAQGIGILQSGIGITLLLNLGLSFAIPNVSIGGHLGGLVVGVGCALALEQIARRRGSTAVAVAVCAAIGLVAAGLAVAVASSKSIPLG